MARDIRRCFVFLNNFWHIYGLFLAALGGVSYGGHFILEWFRLVGIFFFFG